MSRLDNDQDVKETKDAFEGSSSTKIIKIPEDVRTPIYILDPNYEKGYAHYVKIGGKITRVVCAGGLEGEGWAPDVCKLCAYALSLFQEAKKLAARKPNASKKLKKEASDIRATAAAELIVAKGELITIKDRKTGKRKTIPDFEGEGVEVGVLSLTKKQFDDLTGLKSSEEHPYVKTGKDLMNRPIVLDKKKRDGKMYATIKFIPAKKPLPVPDIDYDEDELDISEDFEIDEDKIQEAYELLTGEADYDEDDFEDDAYDYEDDEEEDFEDDEEFEDDDEEEEERPKKKKKGKSTKKKKSSKLGKKADMDDLDDFDEDDEEDYDADEDIDFNDEDDEDVPDFVKKDMGKGKKKKKRRPERSERRLKKKKRRR